MTAPKWITAVAVLLVVGTAGAVRAAEPPKNRWEKALANKNLTVKQRAAYEQIAKLHTAKLWSLDDRGSVMIPSFDPDSKVPTDVLYRMGMDALPFLAQALDDETPTATTTNIKRLENKVWQVNEFAALLIWRIADRDFVVGETVKEFGIHDIKQHPKAAADLRTMVVEWHKKFAAKTPTERKVADVNDLWFRNRFDAIIWLGENRAKDGRAPIAGLVGAFYSKPKRPYDSTTRAEMSHCALALGQIGDKEALPQVRRVCDDMTYWIETYGNSGSAMLHDLFRAYHGLALLDEKDAAIKELARLRAEYGPKFEESYRKEFDERLKATKDW